MLGLGTEIEKLLSIQLGEKYNEFLLNLGGEKRGEKHICSNSQRRHGQPP